MSHALWSTENEDERGLVRFSKYNDLLNRNIPLLINVLDISALHLSWLKIEGVIDSRSNEIIRDASRSQAALRLIEHIQRGPIWRFHGFVRALILSGQNHIVSGVLGLNVEEYLSESRSGHSPTDTSSRGHQHTSIVHQIQPPKINRPRCLSTTEGGKVPLWDKNHPTAYHLVSQSKYKQLLNNSRSQLADIISPVESAHKAKCSHRRNSQSHGDGPENSADAVIATSMNQCTLDTADAAAATLPTSVYQPTPTTLKSTDDAATNTTNIPSDCSGTMVTSGNETTRYRGLAIHGPAIRNSTREDEGSLHGNELTCMPSANQLQHSTSVVGKQCHSRQYSKPDNSENLFGARECPLQWS